MKIDNRDIELTLEWEDDDWCCPRVHALQFVKTPRGKRKMLVEVVEHLKNGRLVSIAVSFVGKRTIQERRKLLSGLIRGGFGANLMPETKEILAMPHIRTASRFFIEFSS